MAGVKTIGPYEVVRELGRGGMGVVHEVRDPALPGRRLALKALKVQPSDADAVARFEREVLLLARVRHKNVVAVHSFAQAREGPYLVMDLVEGRPLDEAALGPREAAALVRDLCDAVGALHAQGVLHRDLKPSNVLRRPDGSPVLLDFGLAREVHGDRLTKTGEIVGTPCYMAPEQARGQGLARLDERTDVWGLGAILFELLGGEPPFAEVGGGPIAVVYAVTERDPVWPSARRPVPPALEAIVRRCMARQRGDRFPSAAALHEALDAFLRGEAPAPRRAAGTLAAVAALALGAVALVSVAAATRPRDPGQGAAAVATRATEPPPPRPSTPRPPAAAPGTEAPWLRRLPQPIPLEAGARPAEVHVRPVWVEPRGLVVADRTRVRRYDVSGEVPVQVAESALLETWCLASDGQRLLVWRREGEAFEALRAADLAPLEDAPSVGGERWPQAVAVGAGRLAVSRAPWAGSPRGLFVGPWRPGASLTWLEAPGNPRALAFSPDGTRLAGASTDGAPGDLYVWALDDVAPRALKEDLSIGPCRAVAFSPDGQTIAAGAESGEVALFDGDGRPRGLLRPGGLVPGRGLESTGAVHTSVVHDLGFAGHVLVTLGGEEDRTTLRAWDTRTWEPIGDEARTKNGRRVALSPDARRVAVLEQGRIGLWELDPPGG